MPAGSGSEAEHAAEALRGRIVRAGAGLLEEAGLDAVSTRAVAARAAVPPPTIFRLFGDKEGLLEAVGEYGFARYLEAKAVLLAQDEDPVEALDAAWNLHVAFGLAHPAYYTLVYGGLRPGHLPPAGRRAAAGLLETITRVAATGRLRMSVERAAAIMHSTAVGTVLTLIGMPEHDRDTAVADTARHMVTTALIDPPPDARTHARTRRNTHQGPAANRANSAGAAMALRTALDQDETTPLSPGERLLLGEWLNRVADARPDPDQLTF